MRQEAFGKKKLPTVTKFVFNCN